MPNQPSNPFQSRRNDSEAAANNLEFDIDLDLPTKTVEEVLDRFAGRNLPDAVDELLFRISMADPEEGAIAGFERYAARLFSEAGASAIRTLFVDRSVEINRLKSTNLFWVNFEDELTDDRIACALSVESALNRLALIERAYIEETGLDPSDTSAALLSEAQCSQFDWQVLRTITRNAQLLAGAEERENRLLEINGASGKPGGNWDLMTRFATSCENMRLPFHMGYRFDCDAEAGVFIVDVEVPAPTQMPQSRWDAGQKAWRSCADEQGPNASAYALRLLTLVAAAAFSTSMGIMRVVVNGYELTLDGPVVMSLGFDRTPFMARTLDVLRSGALEDERLQSDPAALFDLVKPSGWHVSIDEAGCLAPVERLEPQLPERRIPIESDDRALPAELARLLHADRVCDLDVMSEQDEQMHERLRHAFEDADDAPLLAIAQLEDIVSETDEADGISRTADHKEEDADADGDAASAAGADVAAASPDAAAAQSGPAAGADLLYCENAVARYLIDLADKRPDKRWRRASDVGQHARAMLARLYREMDDFEGAVAQARACLKIAPTSPGAYQGLIMAYASRGDFERVVSIGKEALRFAVTTEAASYLYYRLGYAFWKLGRYKEGAACYMKVAPSSRISKSATSELRRLVKESGTLVNVRKTVSSVLRAAGVPLAPTVEALDLLSKLLVGLCDAGFPLVAAPIVSVVNSVRFDDALTSVAGSLRHGVDRR